MIVFESFEKSERCSSCGAVAFSHMVLGGVTEVTLCEFCKQLLLDMLVEDLEV